MPPTQNRLAVKKDLENRIQELQSDKPTLKDTASKPSGNPLGHNGMTSLREVLDGSPLTDLEIKQKDVRDIETLAVNLEKLSPFPKPLEYASQLLDGVWLLKYSTAREIRSLRSLPLGFLVGKIYQIIDVKTTSFENKAWVEHKSGLLSGYVRVTATFEPTPEKEGQLSKQKINVDFKQRFIAITKIIGIKTKLLDPVKVVEAKNPEGRIPSLDITYIDETMRIGRGGDGSLFILTRS